MTYEVLARKWRPKQFAEVVGQDHVTQTLSNAITSKRIAHAYLFVGPRGVGKTTLARIMAKALNCQKGPTPEPCDRCDACREIMAGNSLDVLEIDGASNNGVDQVRDLRDSARYAPARGPFKIYIIDEVHMLSTGAFNALLKTLEEPPAHVKFIFATTEPQKVLPTILSRCQRFDLRRIATKDIVGHLGKIAAAEKIKISEEALLAVARGAEGGLRDAESAMDQLIAFCGRDISEPDVLSVFGLVAWKNVEDLVGSLLRGDVAAMLRLVAELDAAGKDLQRLALELLEYARNLLVVAYAGELISDRDTTEGQMAVLREQVKSVDAARLARIVDVLMEAQGQLRFALSRRTVLEVALVRAARAATVASLDDVMGALAGLPGGLPAVEAGESLAPPPPPPARPPETRAPPQAPSRPAPSAPPPDALGALQAQWKEIVDRVGAVAPLARGYLKDAYPAAVDGDRVTIAFDPEFASSREKIDVPRNARALQKVLEEVLRRPVGVEFKVAAASGPSAPAPRASVPAHAPAADDAAAPAAGKGGKSRADWMKDPAVKRTLEAFSGDIVDIRE